MPLPPDMLHSSVRLSDNGHLRGTGFLVRVPSDLGWGSYTYIITAHHVIRDIDEVRVDVPNPFTNGELYLPINVKDWRQPVPNADLAVAPYPDEGRTHHATWSTAIWPKLPDLGATIYYIGMFQPLDRPIARSGTVAALEQEGLHFSGGRYAYPAHLVDCRSYDGFSGSLCLMELPFARLNGNNVPSWVPQEDLPVAGMNYYTLVCGMFTAHYSDDATPESGGVVSRYGVGVMLPSRFIIDALMTADAIGERAEWDKGRVAKKAAEEPPLQDC